MLGSEPMGGFENRNNIVFKEKNARVAETAVLKPFS